MPRYLTEPEYQRLEQVVLGQTADESPTAVRDRAWFFTLAYTGLRLSELLNLRVGDLDLPAGRLTVRGGKNFRDRVAYLTPALVQALRVYLLHQDSVADDHLWLDAGRPLRDHQVRYCLCRWGQLCDVAITPHRLRHTFATRLINHGLSLESLSKLLGHKHLSMTQRYARIHDATVRNQFQRAMAAIEGIAVSDWPQLRPASAVADRSAVCQKADSVSRIVTDMIRLDTPAGLVEAAVAVEDGLARSVALRNVPSFLYDSDVEVDVPGIGRIKLDVAYAGDLFYAILPAASVGLEMEPGWDREIISIGRRIWEVLCEKVEAQHPEIPQMKGFAGVIFSGPPTHPEATLKNARFGPPGFTDRSPCGTGTCAKMAALFARGELGLREEFVHESVIGTIFRGSILEETCVRIPAIVPVIIGSAYITGFQQMVLDPRDPFPSGFYMGKESELWGAE